MAKSFKTNPALSFISSATAEPETEPSRAGNAAEGRTQDPGPADGKSDYKVNPDFLKPEYRQFAEVKSRRVQILTTPSIYAELKRIAQEKGQSVNEAINQALYSYIEREGR